MAVFWIKISKFVNCTKTIHIMTAKSQGEFGFIDNINKIFKAINSGDYEGIGDDCAVIPISQTESLVITTDMLVEGSHFLLDKISAYDLGWKSLAVNLSDVASMGAKPIASFMSIATTKETSEQWKNEFLRGYYDLSKKHSTELLGGDTVCSNHGVVINITAIGKILNSDIKRRGEAKVGDLIVTTSPLGDSACGLKLLLSNMYDNTSEQHKYLEQKHNRPSAQIEEGIWLAKNGINAMMDISDGISSDLQHICKSSNCGARIFLGSIPFSKYFIDICNENNWDKNTLALSGGEDYSLLFTIDKKQFEIISIEYEKQFKTPLFIIGEITSQTEIEYLDNNKNSMEIALGFRHF